MRDLNSTSMRCTRGFTLVEMVVSLAVMSVLLVGMASTITLASRALPDENGAAAQALSTAQGLHQLRDELRAATALTQCGAAAVTLVLPDRDGDGLPEVVAYVWSGTAGEPLMRSYNHAAADAVTAGLEGLTLGYDTVNTRAVYSGVGLEQSEMLLASMTSTLEEEKWSMTDDDWLGFWVDPALSAAATRWRITRVLVHGQKQGATDGQIDFKLSEWASSGPGTHVYDIASLSESGMGASLEWHEVVFAEGGPFMPGQAVAVSLENAGAGKGGKIGYDEDATPANLFYSEDGGSTWEPETSAGAVQHYVYGMESIAQTNWALEEPRVSMVSVSALPSDAVVGAQHVAVGLSNAPHAASAFWATDFEASPVGLDLDGDGAADWADASNGLEGGRLVSGVWTLKGGLTISPLTPVLSEPCTLELRWRDEVDNGDGGQVVLRVDRAGETQGHVVAQIDLAGALQTLTVFSQDSGGEMVNELEVTAPEGDWVFVGLVVDPVSDRVHVWVDGVSAGSFSYEAVAVDREASLAFAATNDSSGVKVDRVALRVAGVVSDTTEAATSSALLFGVGSESQPLH